MCITLAGLRRACKEFEVRLSEDEARRMIDEAAQDIARESISLSDEDAVVSEAAFMRMMLRSPWY